MGRISDTYANYLLDLAFSKATNNFPATYYYGLSSTLPTNTGGNVTEPSGGAYARASVTNNATNFPVAASRTKANGTAITFPAATADWLAGASIGYFVIYDATSGGNFVGWGELTTPVIVLNGTQPSFAVGALTITAPGT